MLESIILFLSTVISFMVVVDIALAQPAITLMFDFTSISFGHLIQNTENNQAENNYTINVSLSDGCDGRLTFEAPSVPLTYLTYTIMNSNLKLNYTQNATYYPDLLTLDLNRTITISTSSVVYPYYYLSVPERQYAGSYATVQTIEGSCA